MKSSALVLQLAAGLFLICLLALILGSRFLAGERRSGPAVARAEGGATALAPDREDRVHHTRLDGCLLVLAPLCRLEGRSAFEEKWLERVFGAAAADSTFLFLHLWQVEKGGAYRFDPGRDGVELELDSGLRVRNFPLVDCLRDPSLPAADRLSLRCLLPDEPVAVGPEGIARVLLAFPARDAWKRVAAARYLRGNEARDFRAVNLSAAEWEVALSGGPLPAALRPAEPPASR
ncbi:MAG: hypothetical protein JXQ29_08020 [Planctomycetes bacterium]|nr:hypothetical protein [Planctomycetota bacterium]